MERVGYARVSSREQSLEVQLEKLKDCHKIYREKQSGLDGKREKLKECLDYVRDGDILVVTRLDRLARSTLHLCEIAQLLEKKGVSLLVIDQNIDTGTSSGRLLFNMLGAIAQFETEIRAERQAEGIKKALSKGVKFGRKRTISTEDIEAIKVKRDEGSTIKELMREYNISKASIYRYL